MALFQMIFDDKEKQLLLDGLSQLAAGVSYHLITKLLHLPEHQPEQTPLPPPPETVQ